MQSFQDLRVWQRAMEFAAKVYELTRRFPRGESFALTSQLTRAAVSVAGNIAEGHGRFGRKGFAHALAIAKGSLAEAQTYLILARRIGYIAEDDFAEALAIASDVSRMATTLRNRLREPAPSAPRAPEYAPTMPSALSPRVSVLPRSTCPPPRTPC